MKLQQLIPPERICLDIDAKTPEAVIDALIKTLSDAGAIDDPELVKRNVMERERQVGTGIGFGVAIPHSEPGPYPEPIAAFGRLTNPVDFRSPDGKKVRLVFLLLTPEKTPALHVRLLARICRLTRSAALREQLLNVPTAFEAAAKIAELETDYPELTP